MEKSFENIYLISKNNREMLNSYINNNITEIELNKEQILSKMLLDFYNKVFDDNVNSMHINLFNYNFLTYGYNLDNGYYVIYSGYSGYYELMTFGENIDNIFMNLVKNIIKKQSFMNVYLNGRMIKKNYRERFGHISNLMDVYEVEYALDKLGKYYEGNIPEELINEYLSSIDNEEYSTTYDKDNKEVSIIKHGKKRKLFK